MVFDCCYFDKKDIVMPIFRIQMEKVRQSTTFKIRYFIYFNFASISLMIFFLYWLAAWALWFIFRFNIRLCGILFYWPFTIALWFNLYIDSHSAIWFFHKYSLNNSLSGHKKKELRGQEGKIEGKREGSICFQEREIQSSCIQNIKSSLELLLVWGIVQEIDLPKFIY